MMRGKLAYVLCGAAAVAAITLAACAPSSATTDVSGAGNKDSSATPAGGAGGTAVPGVSIDPGAKKGGILTMPMAAAPAGHIQWEEAVTGPMQVTHPSSNQLVQYQSWGSYEKQDYWNIVPDLATSWEQADDGLTWIFHLRDGVEWNDGSAFTCADAKWSFDTIRTGENLRRSPRAVLFRPVKSSTCADDLTLLITLSRPHASFLQLMAMGPNVVYPKSVYEGKAGLDKLRETPKHVGTGPFILDDFMPGESYTYSRNSDYFLKPYPYLDGLKILMIATNAIPPALRAGRVHMGQAGTSFYGSQAEQLIAECKDCQIFPRYNHIGFGALNVNHTRNPWGTKAVRDAIGYAIDQNKLVQTCKQGWDVPARGIIHPDSEFALPDSMLKQIPGFDLSDPAANKDKARKLLADAGFKPGTLKVNIIGPTTYSNFAPCFVEDLGAIGIEAAVIPTETGRFYDSITSGEFEVMAMNYFLTAQDPDVMLYEHFYTGSDRNYGRYTNPEVDRLIDEQSATRDPAARKEKIWKVSEIIMRDQVKLVYHWNHYQPFLGPKVRNYLPGPTCYSHGPCMRFERVWLDE